MKKMQVAMATGFVLVLGTLAACGGQSGLAGEYGKTETGQWFTILDFQGGDRVVLSMIGSEDRFEGSYAREGDSVTVTAAGDTRTLQIDGEGCLDGGPGNPFFSGTICRR